MILEVEKIFIVGYWGLKIIGIVGDIGIVGYFFGY